MTAFPSYSTGTVSVANGDTEIVGADGANWNAVNARAGDDIVIDGNTVVIIDVTDSTHLVIDAWPYTSVSAGATYKIIKRSPLRFAGGDAMADVSELVGALNTDGFFFFVDSDETEPDPSYGNDGQYAMQPSTGKQWVKDSGAWVSQGIYKAFRLTGVYDGGTTYSLNDVATSSGASYVWINETPGSGHAPPNVTYWQLLAEKGDTGSTGPTSGIRQAYSTTTTDSDPGNGTFRLNNATPASATAAYLDNLDAGGATVSGILDLFDDSTSTTKGFIRFQKSTDPAVWAQFRVTGSVVDGTGYRKLTLASGAGSGAFTNGDVFSIEFSRTGDAGDGDVSSANALSEYTGVAATARSNLGIPALLRGHISGLTLSTAGSSSSFGVAVGVATDSTAADVMTLGSAYTKTTSAWSVGSGSDGALDTGTIANNTWYHVWLIKRPDTGVVDVLISLSATSPTMPANYTLKRRIGSMKTNGSAQWIKFSQLGDEFLWDVPVSESLSVSSSGSLQTLAGVPSGVQVNTILYVQWYKTGTAAYLLISSPDVANTAVSSSASTQHSGGSVEGAGTLIAMRTNTSAQLRVRTDANDGAILAVNMGWTDRRGRD